MPTLVRSRYNVIPGLPKILWTSPLMPVGPDDNPMARLKGEVEILGNAFHVVAEAVRDVEGVQTAVLDGETYVDDIQSMCGGRGETVRISGRPYLLTVFPYADH
jgi:hypothetical protein